MRCITLRKVCAGHCPCGNFWHSNSVWLRRFAVLRRAALTVNTVNTVNTVFLFGAPYALHYPVVSLCPSQTRLRQSKPTGYNETPPSSSYKSYRSYKSYASVTPPQTAHPRCHQVAKPYPAVILGTLFLYGCGGLQYRGGRRL